MEYTYIHTYIYYTYLYDLYPRKVSEEIGNSKVFLSKREGSNPMQQLRHQNFMPGSLGAERTGEFFPLGERMEKVLLQLYLVGLV